MSAGFSSRQTFAPSLAAAKYFAVCARAIHKKPNIELPCGNLTFPLSCIAFAYEGAT